MQSSTSKIEGEPMSYVFKKIGYAELNSRQQENYNFQKVAAHLADYGFNCLRLSDDWQGADFIACHRDGETFLKVQLKGRLEIDQKYSGKEIYIAFTHTNSDGSKVFYVYPHDEVRDLLLEYGKKKGTVIESISWKEKGGYSWGYLSADIKELLQPYKV